MKALVLTAKGKLCAPVLVWAEGEALLVETDTALEEQSLPRLERYAISDDVVFESVTPAPPRWHIFGPAAQGREGIRIARLGESGVDVEQAPESLAIAGPEEVEQLRIEQGVPCWGTELDEDTLPQEAGLETDWVDFHKGCYVGQEVVSRIESVGRVNRSLCGFRGRFSPQAGQLISEKGVKSGSVTSAVLDGQSGLTLALGYLNRQAEGTSFSVIDESGACLGEAERSEFPLVP